jgi:uncharacterized protein YaiI (UPF0178 family)
MKILVDADSCPRNARELIVRSAARRGIRTVFAANHPVPGIPDSAMELCPQEAGAADNRIVELALPGDLVVTRDIPLAARLVEASVLVLDDRGSLFTRENVRERLSLRDFMVGLAENGLGKERIPSYGKRELKGFADSLDRALSRLTREGG